MVGFIYGFTYTGDEAAIINVEHISSVVNAPTTSGRKRIRVNTLDGKFLELHMDMDDFKTRLAEVTA